MRMVKLSKRMREKAFQWFMKSAEGDNADGMFKVGFCFENGFGVEQDHAKAYEWYLKSANHGNVSAMHSVGMCYFFWTRCCTKQKERV